MFLSDDEAMNLALSEARKGIKVAPNPPVGCVILTKNRKLLSKGFHQTFGKAHAEVNAIRKIKNKKLLKGASVFVTLEPCSHYGKTPPCAEFLAQFPIKRLVYGCSDPNPLVAGKGLKFLKSKGIKIEKYKKLQEELQSLIDIFSANILEKIPFVALKVATSLDGKIALKNGESRWITEDARKEAHELRSFYKAIAVGGKTLLKDDPLLTARLKKISPTKAIIFSRSEIDISKLQIFQKRPHSEIILIGNSKPVDFEGTFIDSREYDSLKDLLKRLYEEKVYSLLLEGGAELIGSFLKEKLIHKVHIHINPSLIGEGLSWTDHFQIESLEKRIRLKRLKIKTLDRDFTIEGFLNY